MKALAVTALALALAGCSTAPVAQPSPSATSTPEPSYTEQAYGYTPPKASPTFTEVPEAVTSETVSQRNALRKAESYLRVLAFSRLDLIDQLEYNEFSLEDATWAVDHVKVDWNEQAAKKAKSYLNTMSFSRQGLIDQLLYNQFTPEQAEYGVSTTGL